MQMTDIVAPESVRKDALVLARSKIMRGPLSEGVDVTAEQCFRSELFFRSAPLQFRSGSDEKNVIISSA